MDRLQLPSQTSLGAGGTSRGGCEGCGTASAECWGSPLAAASTGLAPVPAVRGAGCVQGGGSAGVAVPRCGTLGLHRASAGACAQHPGVGAVPLMGCWSRGFGQRRPGQHWGEKSGAVGCPLELSRAPGRLDSSCFPSLPFRTPAGSPPVSPRPVRADTRARPLVSPC